MQRKHSVFLDLSIVGLASLLLPIAWLFLRL